jgi:hypothetical protein
MEMDSEKTNKGEEGLDEAATTNNLSIVLSLAPRIIHPRSSITNTLFCPFVTI